MKRRLLQTLITCVVMSSLIVVPVCASPTEDKETLEAKKSEAEAQAASVNEELVSLLVDFNALKQDMATQEDRIAQAETDLAKAKEEEEKQYEDMKLRIKYMYEQGDTSVIETLVSAEDFSDLVNNAEYVQNVYSYDREKLNEYVETKKEVETLKTTLEKEQKDMQSMQTEYEAEEESLNATIEEKQSEISDLDAQLQEAAEAAAAARREQQAEAAGSDNDGSGGSTGSGSGGGDYVSNGDTSAAQTIVNAAYSQLGVPYVWSGTTPGVGLDCSGLVQYCHKVAGISIGRTSGAQGGGGQAVSNPQPGDVVCYSGHVGIYIGGGQMIHAPHTGDVVKIASVSSIGRTYWYRRYW